MIQVRLVNEDLVNVGLDNMEYTLDCRVNLASAQSCDELSLEGRLSGRVEVDQVRSMDRWEGEQY